jgi:signal transduction histidine kinase
MVEYREPNSSNATPLIEQAMTCLRKALGHELPNHLTALHGLVRLLEQEEKDRLSADSQDYLQRIALLIRRIDSLTKSLAELVRIGQEPQTVEAVALTDAVREAVAELTQKYPGQAIEVHYPDPGPVLRFSRSSLHRILIHLFHNAVQAAVPERPLRLEVGATEAPGTVSFWITDNGRGFTEDQRQRLFEPFSPRGPANTGAGLELVLVRQLVARWGGVIEVQSTVGQGSCFTITLSRTLPGDP